MFHCDEIICLGENGGEGRSGTSDGDEISGRNVLTQSPKRLLSEIRRVRKNLGPKWPTFVMAIAHFEPLAQVS